jgi:VWFA-related protein
LFITLALWHAAFPLRAWAGDSGVRQIDLQPYLCSLELQQPNNDPPAGVDFVTDNEVLVYTVCRVNTTLSTRTTAGPEASDPNHLKAVLLDVSTGSVIQSFDWPTRGRGAMVRVTHRGELLVQTDNLLRTVTLEGKPIAAIRLVKVGQSDITFVNSSPAADSLAVIQSSEAQGKTVNGVAVLDAHGLQPKAQWHDNAESWNIAVSGDSAVRTQTSGTRLQMMDLGKASDTNTNWETVWASTAGWTRPLYVGSERFAFTTGNSVVLLAAPGGSDRKDVDCVKAQGVRASRDAGALAAACVRNTMQFASVRRRGSAIVSDTTDMVIEVYKVKPLRKLASVALEKPPGAAFDFALSPSSAKVAVVDQLHLSVYAVSAKVNEPPTAPSILTAEKNQTPDQANDQANDVRTGNGLTGNATTDNAPRGIAPTDGQIPNVQSTTRLVQVDTVVTDSHSRPVPNLTASDFTVLESGKPQKIAFFSYESPEKKVDSGPPHPIAEGAFSNRPETGQSKPIVILLLDGLNTPSSQQLYVRQQMLKSLRNLESSGARMAVLALGSDLTVLQDFTTDFSTLRAAVQDYKRGRTRSDIDVPAIDLPAASGGGIVPASAPSTGGPTGGSLPGVQDLLDFFSRSVANEEQDTRVRMTIAALQAIAQSVAGYPGRKSLLWMSSSFPFTLSFDDSPISHFAFYKTYADDIRKTTSLLTDANVAVYPIDAQGLLSSGGLANVETATATAPTTDLSAEAFKNFRSEETENTVAQETGGKVFRNTNNLADAVKTAVDDSSAYYVLGYYLDQTMLDGKFHTLKVKVNRDGVKVRSRAGFYALDAQAWRKRQDEGASAARLGGLAATGVLFEALPIQPTAQGQSARIEILVDSSTISFGRNPEDSHSIDLNFEVAALKPAGKPAHVETRTVSGDVRDTTYRQFLETGIPMRVEMPLTAGRHLLRVTVRDNRTGHLGSLDVPLSTD